MIEDLKSEVEKVFGKKVATRGDCEQLSDEIYLITKQNLNYNTLRRFFGLAKSTKPRTITLLKLINFIGFCSMSYFLNISSCISFVIFGSGFILNISLGFSFETLKRG